MRTAVDELRCLGSTDCSFGSLSTISKIFDDAPSA
jgi:hypothetical protein